jgi:hypothetical protein
MKTRLSILRVYALMLVVACVSFTAINYKQLSAEEGWGLVGMVGLVGFSALLFVVDIALHNLLKNRITANVVGFIIAVVFSLLLIYSDMFS